MLLLAFETSCDDTSIAIFRDRELVAMKTRSQIREHNETKWVVPEVAARLHANNIFGVLEEVLAEAKVKLEEIDVIACTEFPGLMPSLLVGMSVAKTLAKTLKKPVFSQESPEKGSHGLDTSFIRSGDMWNLHENRALEWDVRHSTSNEARKIWIQSSHFAEIPYISIDHIEAHMFANYIGRETDDIPFPSICLTVSGGHNELYLWKSMFDREKIGETLDDSAGEAFDKVAKMMGFGYPGGPIIGKLASEYSGSFRSIFPKVLLDKEGHDFSFSGLKSAVKREVDRRWVLTDEDIREIAFEFEQTVVDILAYKLFHAAETHGIRSVVLAWGVSANDRLLEAIKNGAKERGYICTVPVSKIYSQDNAAMVGILAYYRYKKIS